MGAGGGGGRAGRGGRAYVTLQVDVWVWPATAGYGVLVPVSSNDPDFNDARGATNRRLLVIIDPPLLRAVVLSLCSPGVLRRPQKPCWLLIGARLIGGLALARSCSCSSSNARCVSASTFLCSRSASVRPL